MTDVQAPLFELADNDANGNRIRGHIALIPVPYDGHDGRDTFAFADEGDATLAFSKALSGIDGRMTPATVRALAAELLAWADRKEGT